MLPPDITTIPPYGVLMQSPGCDVVCEIFKHPCGRRCRERTPTTYDGVWAYFFSKKKLVVYVVIFMLLTVHRILDLYLLTSDVTPRKQQSGPVRKLSDCEELQLFDAIFENPGIYLYEFTMHSHIVYIKLLCHENTVNYTD